MSNETSILEKLEGGLCVLLKKIRAKAPTPNTAEQLEQWMLYVRVTRGQSVRTLEAYIHAMLRFLDWLTTEKVELEAVTARHIETWLNHLWIERRLVAASRVLNLIAVRRFFAWREHIGCGSNPARNVVGPKRAVLVVRKYTSKQLAALFKACDTKTLAGRRDLSILLFAYATGARSEETAALNLEQLELHERVGRVRFFGKGGKERVVSFDGVVVDVLRAWLHDRSTLDSLHEQHAVWVGLGNPNLGGRLQRHALRGILRRAGQRAGIPLGDLKLHRLRATFATDLYDAGFDLLTISNLLGHAAISTTRMYIAASNKAQNSRMPATRLKTLLGEEKQATPLWLQRKQQQRGMHKDAEQFL